MQKVLSLVLIFSVFLVSFQTGFSQNTSSQTKKRPKIGLVLSGGGARGFAHIGVLKVLEENRVPIDYVGGASMGALVGALYAMGKTPDEIEQFVNGLNWDKYLQATTSFENLSFRRKEDRRNIPSPITLKGKPNDLKLPSGLNTGHEIGLLFDDVTLPYALVRNFDNFPIPFRCVGTDMVTGQSVTLKDGSISHALRATMSIPGAFTPVELNGKILADGGLVNNIPTNVVKEMGADILLVVNIETQLATRESLDNLLGVLAQTINIASADNSRRSLQQADIIIAPNLENYSIGDFVESKKIIELGYSGAQQKTSLLSGISLSEAEWQEHLAQRQKRRQSEEPPIPKFVAVEAKNKDSVQTIEEKLNSKYVNLPFDETQKDELAKDLSQLVGTGRFDALDYDLTQKNGQTGLVINTNEPDDKPAKPTRLELGFDVNSVETDNVNFNFMARMTMFDIGRYGAEWRNDVRIGSNTLLNSEYYRPLGKTNFFVAPRVTYSRNRINFFEDGNRTSEYSVQRFQLGLDSGYIFNVRSELRLGYKLEYVSASRRIGDNLFPTIKGRFSNATLGWTYDGLNTAQVPTKGIYSKNSINYYFDSADNTNKFAQAETQNLAFHPLSERSVLLGFANMGTSFGDTAPQLRQFTLGGPFKVGGYGYDEFRASNYAHAGIGYLYNPINFSSFLGGKVYVGGWYEGGSAFEKFNDIRYRQSITGGTIIETPLGPVFLGTSINDKGRGRIYFSFGRIFKFDR